MDVTHEDKQALQRIADWKRRGAVLPALRSMRLSCRMAGRPRRTRGARAGREWIFGKQPCSSA